MKPAPFRYARPGTLGEVHDLLAASDGEARLLAGGQSLLPLLNLRRIRAGVLIDLALAPELQVLRREGDELVIGAAVRQRAAETSSLVHDLCPLIPRALRFVGHVQTRNRGTVGGSLAHAHPAAELAGAAVALDATLVASSSRGQRVIEARDFFLGPHATALAPDEVLTEVRLPVRPDARHAFVEVARSSGDFGVAGIAAVVRVESGSVGELSLAAVGVADRPLRLSRAEEAARGLALGPAERADVAAAAVEEVRGYAAADGAHRRRIVGTLVARALEAVAA